MVILAQKMTFNAQKHGKITMEPILVISTFPDKDSVKKLAAKLVSEKIVACVNMTKISSIYSWQGKIEDSDEYLALFKTNTKNKDTLKQKIKESHPYDVPEIAEIQFADMDSQYLKWLIESTTSE